MSKTWILTEKGKRVVKEADKIYPKVKQVVLGDGFLFSIAIASDSFNKNKETKK